MVSSAQALKTTYATLLNRLADARDRTDSLFEVIRPAALYSRPIPERHRLIFYLGHLEAFDWNLIARGAAKTPSFDPALDKLFAFGIDPVDGQLPSDVPSDWPAEAQVRGYNRQVRDTLDSILAARSLSEFAGPDASYGTLLHVAIEHRLMHAETLAYLLHQVPFDQKIHGAERQHSAPTASVPQSVMIPAGSATLGIPRDTVFGWDNEFEEVRVHVPEFRADVFPVTNAQFLDFVRAGGYTERSLWTDDDWAWKTQSAISHPHFWVEHPSGDWRLRTMFEDISLPASWPVYVSHAEASAYTRWTGKKLPNEAQWHRLAYGTPEGNERAYPWGEAPPAPRFGTFDFERWDPSPVNAHPGGRSAFGVADLVGNGWEWTSTPFAPLPGFRSFPFYPGYSANFFDGKHYVLKGGSPQTAACMLRRSFRNWFQPHYPYIYTKFRCVED